MNNTLKKGTAIVVMGTMMATGISTTAFAASEEYYRNNNDALVVETNIYSDTVQQDTSNVQERSVISSTVKSALTFLRNNASKVEAVLKKYGITLAEGKGVVAVIDDILDGVIEVSDSIDAVIYTIVDTLAPDSFEEGTKQIIANVIRLLLPV